jgi:hypothetical protein
MPEREEIVQGNSALLSNFTPRCERGRGRECRRWSWINDYDYDNDRDSDNEAGNIQQALEGRQELAQADPGPKVRESPGSWRVTRAGALEERHEQLTIYI